MKVLDTCGESTKDREREATAYDGLFSQWKVHERGAFSAKNVI